MNKVCIFGGAGFIGSHVADLLADKGYQVRIFDIKKSPWINRANQEFQLGDVTDPESIDAAVNGCSIVYNFAALADLNAAVNRPIETININILGNALIMDACVRYKVERFMYASSVYVNSRLGGFYRCSKHAAEQYIEEYQKVYGLNFTILRYGSLYGPRSGMDNGIYRIIKTAIEKGTIEYEGSSETLREYIHVRDAASASVNALGEDFKNESVVLTGHEPMRVSDFLQMISEILDIKEPVRFIENQQQQHHYVRTPYAFQTKLGKKYIPSLHVDLGQGLIELMNEIKSSQN